MAVDRAKVIEALRHCSTELPCIGKKMRTCPYRNYYINECVRQLCRDALAVIIEGGEKDVAERSEGLSERPVAT